MIDEIMEKSINIVQQFFDRTGGVSKGLYASLNCGIGSHDDASAVQQNKQIVAQHFGLTAENLATLRQIHSAKAVFVDQEFLKQERPEADAMVTASPNIILGILTADCVPVLLQDDVTSVIGAAHAGWKGAHGGVIENTIALMQKHGSQISQIRAFIGPAINQESYEISTEFRDRLLLEAPSNAAFFIEGTRGGHYQFDLKDYVKNKLEQAGVTHIEMHADDTCALAEKYFSYRRSCLHNEPDYGRQLSGIVMKETL